MVETATLTLGRQDPLENEMATYLLQYSCLESSMDRGAWQATVHGVSKSQTISKNTTGLFQKLPECVLELLILKPPQRSAGSRAARRSNEKLCCIPSLSAETWLLPKRLNFLNMM